MTNKSKWIALFLGIGMVVAVGAGVVAFGFTTNARAQEATLQGSTPDFFAHRGGRGFPGAPLAGNEYLAEALGISVEELQDAQQEARDAAIQMASDQGLITQEQADALLLGEFWGRHAFGGIKGGWFGAENGIDHEALLADALGISVEELQTARQEAQDAALAQAVEDGTLTQDQVDMLKAMQALKSYIDPQALFAEALGISTDQLQAYRDEGLSISEILNQLGLTATEVRDAAQAAHENAIQQAVEDGVITQDQVDQLSSGAYGKRGGFFGRDFGGRGGMLPPDGTLDGMRVPRFNTPSDTTSTAL